MSDYQKKIIMNTQANLLKLGFDPKGVDGIWGKNTESAYNRLILGNVDPSGIYGLKAIPWGQKFTDQELHKLAEVIRGLGLPTTMVMDFMACIAWETGEKFAPDTKNPASTGTGLIQFMAATARGLGTTVEKLAKMTVIEQLDYVGLYFKPYRNRIRNLGDIYSAIIWPAAVGKPDDFVLWNKNANPAQYKVNSGLDTNQDGTVTRLETLYRVRDKMVKGFLPQFVK